MTLRINRLIVEARQRHLVDEHNERVWLAWNIVALQQQKRLPKLQSLLMRYPRNRPQTVDEMKADLRRWAGVLKDNN